MQIISRYGLAAAPTCTGDVVIIDVLRSCTTAAFAFNQGAKQIYLVATPEEAFALKAQDPALLLIGEEQGVQIPGFDFGNSPDTLSKQDLQGKSLVLRSSSGTQGVVQAKNASQIFLGALVNAQATAAYLKQRASSTITLLAMGSLHGPDKEEDLACARYLAALLQEEPLDPLEILTAVRQSPSGLEALDPAIKHKTKEDLECAVALNKFTFIMPVYREGLALIARPLF